MATKSAAERLKLWREASGLSQVECASRIGGGQPAWSEWEAGTKVPRVDKCFAIEKLTKGAVPASAWAAAAARGAA
jgi:transcriptional regulator with XRE-family HTH domain